jgi:hypothetical protein
MNFLSKVILIILSFKNLHVFTTKLVGNETSVFDRVIVAEKIVNPHPFDYILNPGVSICSNKTFLLVYVHSAPKYYKRRIAIRETWANMFEHMRIVFMLGDSKDEEVKSQLKYEFNLYGDLVQENFLDSYHNLTYKGIMSLKWINEFCSRVKYILKVDDDMIVDVFLLWRHLKKLDEFNLIEKKAILCNVWIKMKVMRKKNSKWYVSPNEFKENYYGKYCSGSAYLITKDLAIDMYKVSKYIKFFWVDDYYVSGLLARASNATYFTFNKFYTLQSKFINDKFKISETIFGHVSKNINNFYNIWHLIFNKQIKLIPKLPIDQLNELKPVIKDFWWSKEIFY